MTEDKYEWYRRYVEKCLLVAFLAGTFVSELVSVLNWTAAVIGDDEAGAAGYLVCIREAAS